MGSGTRNIENAHPDTAGEDVTQDYTNGAGHVTTSGIASAFDTRTAKFNAAADLPANEASVQVGELITLNGFTSGKKRCRITFHSTAAGTNIPFAGAVGAVLNGSAAAAAAILSVTDVSEGGTGAADNGGRMVSQTQPVIEFDLNGSTDTVTTVYLVGYAPGGTGVAIVHVSVEVW